MPGRMRQPKHDLGVDEVLGTPEGNQPDLHDLQVYSGNMRKRFVLTVVLVAMATVPGIAQTPPHRTAVSIGTLLDRFLAPDDQPLVSYRAYRRLTASTRGGRMTE